MSAAKRSHSVNFTSIQLLPIEEDFKNKSIIKCKTTNKLNWNEKILPTTNFHASTLDEFDNIKSKARQKVAKLRCYQGGTGGGPYTSIILDTSRNAVLDLLNLKTVMELDAESGSDSIETSKDMQSYVGDPIFKMDVNNILIVEKSLTTSKDE
ncbi:unnamed protein product [Diabrotica balteata]|uniref:Uncharacterized protein n=1 Tax=Diabrotica balteata TaxID=107213 RepID=A0A9N9SSF2_DIABA|nr:unnamed protein product [Diabrotica balteata]